MKRHIENQLSDDMLHIVCEPPSWLMRAGISTVASIILLFFIGTWVLKYPEILKGNAIIATQAPAIRVVSPASARMVKLLAQDGMMVKKGDILAETENTMHLENIPAMQQMMRQTQAFLQDPKRNINFPAEQFTWGDLQQDFNILRQSYLDFKRLQSDNHQNLQMHNLQKQTNDLQNISAYQLRQKQLIEQSAEHAKEIFHTDEQLYTEGVTSKLDLLKSKNKLLEKQNEQEDFNKTMLATSLKIKELEQNVNDINFSFLEKKRASLDNIAQALANIENSLKHWQQDYLITAPADGKLVFLKDLTENQFLKATDTLFAVMPAQENYIATVDIAVRGMGKAEIGQKVIIKLDDYPYQEFGMLEGEVQSVFPSLNIRYYRVVVSLPKGLKSTYKHQFYCRSEMAGTAEIVTADMRMLERAFYGFRKLLG